MLVQHSAKQGSTLQLAPTLTGGAAGPPPLPSGEGEVPNGIRGREGLKT